MGLLEGLGDERPKNPKYFKINIFFCRKNVLKYKPRTALNLLSTMPGFDNAFNSFLYKRIQKEADEGCRNWDDPAPRTFTIEDVEEFDSVKFYEKLSATFPTLLTSLAAVTTKKRNKDAGVQVSLSSREIIIR